MIVNFFKYDYNSTGSIFNSSGFTMQGPLILAGNPTQPLEAAPKQYVDSAVQNLNAANITSGVLSAARLPGFTGDVIVAPGTSNIVLSNTGVTPGTIVKPTVDAKGRVLSGGSLVESDIPGISFEKISVGRPTTLNGYGITDAVPISGNVTMQGNLILNGQPTSNGHAATKSYVDTSVNNVSGVAVGDIILKPYSTTPPGFLKCNGALVDKTTYANLYAVIGDRFGFDIMPGSGQPWRQQYQINTTQSGDITGWTTGTPLPAAFGVSQAIVTKNRVYILGGWYSNNTLSTVYTAPINSDGTLGAWTTTTSLPNPCASSQAIVTKNRVYLLGGYNGAAIATIYTAPINSDGTLGTWTTSTPLPGVLGRSQAIVTKNRVYLLGGDTSGSLFSVSTVYTAPINSDGTLGTWTTGTSLPIAIGHSQAIVTKNRVYLLGGYNNSNGALSTVYTAPINSDGTLGDWTASVSLPSAISHSQAIVTKNRVYLLGGNTNISYLTPVSTVYTAPINSDGTLGTWTTGTSLPGAISGSKAIVTRNRVYLLGGFSSSYVTATSTVYTAPLSGGLNDYSPYYDGTFGPSDPSKFNLPDYTLHDSEFGNSVTSYIKF